MLVAIPMYGATQDTLLGLFVRLRGCIVAFTYREELSLACIGRAIASIMAMNPVADLRSRRKGIIEMIQMLYTIFRNRRSRYTTSRQKPTT